MKYDYCAHFTPIDIKPKNCTEVRTVEFVSENMKPEYEDINHANAQHQKKIDAYVARNYWDLYSFEIEYAEKNWSSIPEVTSTIRNELDGRTTTQIGDKYSNHILVKHEQKCGVSDIAEIVEENFDTPVDETFQMKRKTRRRTLFKYRWTEVL